MYFAEKHPYLASFIGILLLVVTHKIEAQQTINVPEQAATIQAGIDAAANGDTVLVAPGTYVEVLDFKGKNITVASSKGAADTVIDGNQNAVVVSFHNGETRSAVLSGFTIEHAALPADATTFLPVVAGIYIYNAANPTIQNNIITNNHGFGMVINSGALVTGNTVSFTATAFDPSQDFGCDYNDGAGISIYNPLGTNVEISNNTIKNNVGHCLGGGIQAGASGYQGSLIIKNNINFNNQSLGYGGGIAFAGGGPSTQILQNLIYGNTSGAAGGGVYLGAGSVQPGPLTILVTNNTIVGNTIVKSALIQDTGYDGSGIAFGGAGTVGFFNNIVISGDADTTAACYGTPPVALNNDILNTSLAGSVFGGTSCTQPQPQGNSGNRSVDPKFVDASNGNYHLQSGAPAIDAGFNSAPGLLVQDLDGSPRVQNATGASVAIVDMGAYEAAGTPDSRSSSQTVITGSASTVTYGQNISLTGQITSVSPANSGSMTFMDDWSPLGSITIGPPGSASFSVQSLSVGTHWLQASYGGSSTVEPSISDPISIVVQGFPTVTTLNFPQNSIYAGVPVTLSAQSTATSGGTPTGSIAFVIDGSTVATIAINSSGAVSFTSASLASGTHYVQAIYQPTGGFLMSSSLNRPMTVLAEALSVALVSSSSTIVQGQSVTLTATLTNPAGAIAPTGSIDSITERRS